jgi:hypothetical protein
MCLLVSLSFGRAYTKFAVAESIDTGRLLYFLFSCDCFQQAPGKAMARSWIQLTLLLCFGAIGCNGDGNTSRLTAARTPPPAETTKSRRPVAGKPSDLASVPLEPSGTQPAGTPLFELLPSARTGVDFRLALPDVEQHVREVIHLNVQGGICSGDYDGDGLTDFYVTSTQGDSRLYRNVGDFRFQDVTTEAGLAGPSFWATGATFVDIDNDADLDIYVCGYRRANRLFINDRRADGSVEFTDRARHYGLEFTGASMTMAFADIENDGDLDGYLATTALAPPPGVEFRVRFEDKKPVVLEPLREYWELIYLPGERAHRTEAGQFDHLFRNDGQYFTEITRQAGIDGAYFTLAATWWDYNHDGFPDLYAANDFLGADRLYHNKGDGTFADVAQKALPHIPWFSMGTDLADVNNDGQIDFLATDMAARTHHREMVMRGNLASSEWFHEVANPPQYVRNALYLNTGAGQMIEAANQANVANTDWTWNPRLADFDNDGRVDLFITTGVVRDTMNSDLGKYADTHFAPGSAEWARFWAQQSMHKEANIALRNMGDLKFEDVGAAWGLDRVGVSFGAATADFDNDGDLDLVVNNADVPLSIYRNQSDSGHRVRIHLKGRTSNRFGIGATIELVAGKLRQTSYLTLARGWLSAVEPVTTFGLGDAKRIDKLTVRWPSGHWQVFEDLAVNQIYTITEPSGESPIPHRAAPPANFDAPAIANSMFVADARFPKIEHTETAYDDFAREPLLPHKLSEPGPAMAWGDVNGDQRADLYVGGSKGQPGQLYLGSVTPRPVPVRDRERSVEPHSHADGSWFEPVSVAAFDSNREADETCAVFFDADADSDQDLFIVTGSTEHDANHEAYRDHLYYNDGHGEFLAAPDGALPDLRDSGSVAAASDFDHDGDIDLFVGSRSLPGQYPLPPPNRLLVNTGGRFQENTPDRVRQAGMVTSAIWSDVDDDGWDDLLITTDWGPVRLFTNERGQLVEKTQEAGLADRLGWWNAIAARDFDEDGDEDFVVTNLGLNTSYRASVDEPAVLYYGDFDGSGQHHIVEAKREGSTWYPRRDRTALSNAMPAVTTNYNTFDEFGKATLAEIFTQDRLEQSLRLEVNTLHSGLLLNDGQLRFRFEPLPALAQVAPCHGIAIGELNGDDHLDIVLAQNFYSSPPVTGRMDGGVSLLLVGTGDGTFEPIWPNRSGIVVPGEARKVSVVDLNGDDRLDLVFAVRNGLWKAFRNRSYNSQLPSPGPSRGRGEGN